MSTSPTTATPPRADDTSDDPSDDPPASEAEPVVYELPEMSGFDFEDAVEVVFERLGYRVESQPKTGDMGRDVVARSNDETLVVECKHTQSATSRPVVQKLHSAAMTYDSEARGIIVSTGGFTGPAEEYAHSLDDTLRLWNYATLVEHARSVDVYFTSEQEDTAYVFRGPERSHEETRARFEETFVEEIESEPRDLDRAVDVQCDGREYVPAVLIRYELDETFGTQTYPELYRARDRGRHLVPLEDIPDKERDLWRSTSFSVTCSSRIDGRPPEAYFGVDLSTFEARISRRLARDHSTVKHYTGRNNQDYTKECEVEPGDVETRCRQVLLCRQYVHMGAGPEDYEFAVSGHREQPPAIVEAHGLDRDEAGRIRRRRGGVLCNDCGEVEPKGTHRPPATCDDCDRTLCHRHHWDYPSRWPLHAPALCSDCYRSTVADDPSLTGRSPGLLAAGLLGPLVPGLSHALVGRYLACVLLMAAFFAPLAAGTSVLTLDLAAPTYGLGGLAAAGALWLVHAAVALAWTLRLRKHRRNLDDHGLKGYAPDWR